MQRIAVEAWRFQNKKQRVNICRGDMASPRIAVAASKLRPSLIKARAGLQVLKAAIHQPTDAVVDPAVDLQMLSLMRCLLFIVALAVAYFHPGLNPWPAALKLAMLAYAAYAVALCTTSIRSHPSLSRAQPWIDALFYAYLISLTGGTASIIFHFYFFAIIVASLSRGFREGLAVTMFAVLCFAANALWASASGMRFDLNEALSRSVSLFILGYMTAYWGGNELASRKRLKLLRDLAAASEARAGIDSLMARQMRCVLEFFDAETCLAVLPKHGGEICLLYRVDRARAFAVAPPDELSKELGKPLLGLPATARVSFDHRPRPLRAFPRFCRAWGPKKKRCDKVSREDCQALANLLEASSFASVPYKPTQGLVGRLFLTTGMRRFSEVETEYLAQVATQMAAALNNALLTEELTQNVAQEERSKISRDIHDTTVQSYIGLKLGLEALYRDLGPASNVGSRIKELLDMANFTVEDLRGYINRLRGRYASRPKLDFLTRIEEQRRRYRDLHGIDVQLRTQRPLEVDPQLGTQAYQLVSEALSNVFRHTTAKQAFINLRCQGDTLSIEVGNTTSQVSSTAPFMPRSITERAISLGGKVEVRLNNDGHDVVQVMLPIGARTGRQQRAAIAD